MYDNLVTVEIDKAVVARIEKIVAWAKETERDGQPTGMTTLSGALDWALDMATEHGECIQLGRYVGRHGSRYPLTWD